LKDAVIKAKSYAGSKVAETKLGRQAIAHYLGKDGSELVSALHAATVIDIGAKNANKIVMDILQLALTCRVLQNQKSVSILDQISLVEPINTLTIMFFHRLQISCRVAGAEPADPFSYQVMLELPAFLEKISEVRELTLNIFKKHVNDAFLSQTDAVLSYFGSTDFLVKFLLSKEMSKEKLNCFHHMQSIVAERLTSTDGKYALKCEVTDCYKHAAIPAGQFKGSTYCATHHVGNFLALHMCLLSALYSVYNRELSKIDISEQPSPRASHK
jgi:hypothetical protein